jgi:hypothetical protein
MPFTAQDKKQIARDAFIAPHALAGKYFLDPDALIFARYALLKWGMK